MLQSTAVMDAGEGLTLEPLSPTIGTVIHGIDLAAPTAAQVAIVWQQVLAHYIGWVLSIGISFFRVGRTRNR